MSEALEQKITKLKAGSDFLADITVQPGNHIYHGIADYVKRGFQNAGYLLSRERCDTAKGLYTCTIFENMDEGRVYTKAVNNEDSIKGVIRRYVVLNKHAEFKDFVLGWDNDDYVTNRVTIRINFKFLHA